jgi:hypothetical protein
MRKKVLFVSDSVLSGVLFAVFLVGLAGIVFPQKADYSRFSLEVRPGDEVGWENYVHSPELKGDNIPGFPLNQEIPEAVVLYFYSHLMRGEEACQDVLYASSSAEEEYSQVKNIPYRKVRLVRKKRDSLSRIWIELYFETEHDGKKKKGKGDIELLLTSGKWWITNLPL